MSVMVIASILPLLSNLVQEVKEIIAIREMKKNMKEEEFYFVAN